MYEYTVELASWPGINPSRAHIRVLDAPDKPLTIVCSQLPGARGTSVTNLAEEYRELLRSELLRGRPSVIDQVRAYFAGATLDRLTTDLVVQPRRRKAEGDAVYVADTIRLALDFAQTHKRHVARVSDLVWVEHYPIGEHYFKDRDHYSMVEFDPETGSPAWRHVSPEYVAEKTGYAVDQIRKVSLPPWEAEPDRRLP